MLRGVGAALQDLDRTRGVGSRQSLAIGAGRELRREMFRRTVDRQFTQRCPLLPSPEFDASVTRRRQRFAVGLSAFHEARWLDAAEQFEAVLTFFPGDGPSRFYLQRCLRYNAAPPSERRVIRVESS